MCKTNHPQELPNPFAGISVIYFNDESRNRCAKLSADRELAKQLAQLIYHDVKITINQNKRMPLGSQSINN